MNVSALFVTLLALSSIFSEVRCVTNQGFFDLLKNHVQVDPDDVSEAVDSDVIQLPGNGNDELDVPYLLSRIELLDTLKDLNKETIPARRRTRRVGWFHHIIRGATHVVRWFRHPRRRSSKLRKALKDTSLCHLYLDHDYEMNLEPEPVKFRLNACLKFALITGPDDQVALLVTNYKKSLIQRQISLEDTSTSCVPLAKLGQFADVCFETYRPDLEIEDKCVRLRSNITLKTKRYRVELELWCGHVPEVIVAKDIRRIMENMQVSVQNDETGELENIPMYDLTNLYRELQNEQGFDKGLGKTDDGYKESQDFSIEE